MDTERRWVSKSQACRAAGISWGKLDKLIQDGRVRTQKSIRKENVIYVDVIALREYLAQDAQVQA